MSELIDRQALKNKICDCCEGKDEWCNGPCFEIMIIDSMPAIAASQWHMVEEELPESGEFGKIVLACNDVGTVNAAFLSSSGKWYAANNTMYDAWTWMPNVTHWMPLPEPPKEDA